MRGNCAATVPACCTRDGWWPRIDGGQGGTWGVRMGGHYVRDVAGHVGKRQKAFGNAGGAVCAATADWGDGIAVPDLRPTRMHLWSLLWGCVLRSFDRKCGRTGHYMPKVQAAKQRPPVELRIAAVPRKRTHAAVVSKTQSINHDGAAAAKGLLRHGSVIHCHAATTKSQPCRTAQSAGKNEAPSVVPYQTLLRLP